MSAHLPCASNGLGMVLPLLTFTCYFIFNLLLPMTEIVLSIFHLRKAKFTNTK